MPYDSCLPVSVISLCSVVSIWDRVQILLAYLPRSHFAYLLFHLFRRAIQHPALAFSSRDPAISPYMSAIRFIRLLDREVAYWQISQCRSFFRHLDMSVCYDVLCFMTQCRGRYSDFPALSLLVRYRPASIFFRSSFRPLLFPCLESLCFSVHLASQFGLLSPSPFVSATMSGCHVHTYFRLSLGLPTATLGPIVSEHFPDFPWMCQLTFYLSLTGD